MTQASLRPLDCQNMLWIFSTAAISSSAFPWSMWTLQALHEYWCSRCSVSKYSRLAASPVAASQAAVLVPMVAFQAAAWLRQPLPALQRLRQPLLQQPSVPQHQASCRFHRLRTTSPAVAAAWEAEAEPHQSRAPQH